MESPASRKGVAGTSLADTDPHDCISLPLLEQRESQQAGSDIKIPLTTCFNPSPSLAENWSRNPFFT